MNTIEEDLFAWLSTDSAGLVPLVGTRIFPNRIPPETTPRPWLHYSVTSSEPAGELKQTQTIISEVEFSIYAERYEDVRAITTALVTRLDGFRGGVIKRVLWDNYYATDVEEGHLGTVIFRVWSGVSGTIAPRGGTARVVFDGNTVDVLPNGQDSVATFATNAVTFHAPLYGDASNMTGIPTPDLTQYAKKDAANVFTPANALTLPIEIIGISGLTQPLFRIRNDVGTVVLRCNNSAGSVEVNRINATSGRWDFLGPGEMLLAAEVHWRFSDAGASGGPWNTGIRRSSAGVIDITNGTTSGALGRLRTLGYFVRSGSANPTTSDLADGYSVVWRNTTSGEVRVWCNISGVMLSTPALE